MYRYRFTDKENIFKKWPTDIKFLSKYGDEDTFKEN